MRCSVCLSRVVRDHVCRRIPIAGRLDGESALDREDTQGAAACVTTNAVAGIVQVTREATCGPAEPAWRRPMQGEPLMVSPRQRIGCLTRRRFSWSFATRARSRNTRCIDNVRGQPKPASPARFHFVIFIRLTQESFVGVHAGRMVLGLQHPAVRAQKCNMFGIPNEDVAVHRRAIERYGCRARYVPRGVLGNAERPFLTCCQRKHEIDETDAVKMSDVTTIFTPNKSLVVGANVLPFHNTRSETRFVRVPV